MELIQNKPLEERRQENHLKLCFNFLDQISELKKKQPQPTNQSSSLKFHSDKEFSDSTGNQHTPVCSFDLNCPQKVNKFVVKVETKDQGWASSNSSGSWVTFRLIDVQNKVIMEENIYSNLRVPQYV